MSKILLDYYISRRYVRKPLGILYRGGKEKETIN